MVEHIVVRCCSCHMAQVWAIVLAHMEVMVRCCSCHYGAITVQVRQCTKVRKYACKMCGTPQSYGKVCVPPLHFKFPGAQGRAFYDVRSSPLRLLHLICGGSVLRSCALSDCVRISSAPSGRPRSQSEARAASASCIGGCTAALLCGRFMPRARSTGKCRSRLLLGK